MMFPASLAAERGCHDIMHAQGCVTGVANVVTTDLVMDACLVVSSRRRHTRLVSDWSSDVFSSDLKQKRTHMNSPHLTISCALFCLNTEQQTSELPALINIATPLLIHRAEMALHSNKTTRSTSEMI